MRKLRIDGFMKTNGEKHYFSSESVAREHMLSGSKEPIYIIHQGFEIDYWASGGYVYFGQWGESEYLNSKTIIDTYPKN